MKILLTGATGQVGHELQQSLRSLGEVVALDRSRMDLSDLDQVRDVIRAEKPTLIVNPAAYTAVDKAESEPEIAFRINAEAPGEIARWCCLNDASPPNAALKTANRMPDMIAAISGAKIRIITPVK